MQGPYTWLEETECKTTLQTHQIGEYTWKSIQSLTQALHPLWSFKNSLNQNIYPLAQYI